MTATDDEARALLPTIAEARERFMELVADVRPELHRYCARMTGSVFDGEDVVQETLAKACFALAQLAEPPPLRPWLFRIAHNTAMDFLRRYERRNVDFVPESPEAPATDEREVDAALVDAALEVFVALPPVQRSALALKDVLGHSLEQTAATMGTTVAAVKAALARARANVAAHGEGSRPRPSTAVAPREQLSRYAELFNARNWDGLRALLAEEARLDLVSRSQRRGAATRFYYTRYAELADVEGLRAVPGLVGEVAVLAIFRADDARPAYFIQLEWQGDRVASLRDFRYVPYIADAAMFTPFATTPPTDAPA